MSKLAAKTVSIESPPTEASHAVRLDSAQKMMCMVPMKSTFKADTNTNYSEYRMMVDEHFMSEIIPKDACLVGSLLRCLNPVTNGSAIAGVTFPSKIAPSKGLERVINTANQTFSYGYIGFGTDWATMHKSSTLSVNLLLSQDIQPKENIFLFHLYWCFLK